MRLTRQLDIALTGKRHPYLARYDAGFAADGTLQALRVSLWSDGGYSLDLSRAIMWRSMFHCDNAYLVRAVEVEGRVCLTHKTSQTALRGFGGPQGMVVIEEVLAQGAARLGLAPEVVRERNLYRPGDTTHYGQPVEGADRIATIWTSLTHTSAFDRRRTEIDAFNATSRHVKRGLAITPAKFGISFTPNASATAASTGTDLNGAAVVDACTQIAARLATVAAAVLACDHPFHYFTYGAAVSEVEVDGFTGTHRLRRVDILQDVGDSIAPLIDRGQIEGGFIQGVGWLTVEELLWDAHGRVATASASTYKLPSWSEVPEVFNVDVLPRATHPGVVFGSKAVGEPPLMLAISVREALRDAVAAFGTRAGAGRPVVTFDSPATPERLFFAIRRAAYTGATCDPRAR